MPQNRDTTPIRVLHITDTHLFGDPAGTLAGVATDPCCLEVLAHARQHVGAVDLVLLTGDLVHDRSLTAYQRLHERMAAFQVPVLVIPGNHDDRVLMRQVYDRPPVHWTFDFRLGGWLFIGLDSSVPGKPDGWLDEGELARLERTLEMHPDQHVVICLHHQPVAMGSEWLDRIGAGNGEALMEIAARFPSVRAVIWGHVHQAVDRYAGHLRLLATPSTCVQFRPGQKTFTLDGEPPGYRTLELSADGRVESRLFRLPGPPPGLQLETVGY